MTNSITTRIYYGIYDLEFHQFYIRNDYSTLTPFIIPEKFKEFIQDLAETKWAKQYRQSSFIHFTIGKDGDIYALSVVHPRERNITLKQGKDIVEGRLNRQLGLLNRVTYDLIPELDDDDKPIIDKDGMIVLKPLPRYIYIGD